MDSTTKEKINFSKGSRAGAQINKEFYDPKWESFRKWYFQSFSKHDFNYIITTFYEECTKQNKMIYFVPWFIKTFLVGS